MNNSNEPNLNGPEAMPLRDFIKSFKMSVTVVDVKGKEIRKEQIDYGIIEHRKWLGKVTYWACEQGYSVVTKKADK